MTENGGQRRWESHAIKLIEVNALAMEANGMARPCSAAYNYR
jgi:hypothetical protein